MKCEHVLCSECKKAEEKEREWYAEARRMHELDRRPMTLDELTLIGRHFEDARLIEKFKNYWEWTSPACSSATSPDLYGILDSISEKVPFDD